MRLPYRVRSTEGHTQFYLEGRHYYSIILGIGNLATPLENARLTHAGAFFLSLSPLPPHAFRRTLDQLLQLLPQPLVASAFATCFTTSSHRVNAGDVAGQGDLRATNKQPPNPYLPTYNLPLAQTALAITPSNGASYSGGENVPHPQWRRRQIWNCPAPIDFEPWFQPLGAEDLHPQHAKSQAHTRTAQTRTHTHTHLPSGRNHQPPQPSVPPFAGSLLVLLPPFPRPSQPSPPTSSLTQKKRTKPSRPQCRRQAPPRPRPRPSPTSSPPRPPPRRTPSTRSPRRSAPSRRAASAASAPSSSATPLTWSRCASRRPSGASTRPP